MATLSIVLKDKKKDGTYNIKFLMVHHTKPAYISTPYYVLKNQFHKGKVVKHDNATLYNNRLREKLTAYERKLDGISVPMENMTVQEIKKYLTTDVRIARPKLLHCIKAKMDECEKLYKEKVQQGRKASDKTFYSYQTLRNSLFEFLKPENLAPKEDQSPDFDAVDVYVDEVNVSFLKKYEQFLTEKGLQNGRWNKMKDLRAIFNEEINEGNVSADLYPFKKYNINKLRKQTEPNVLEREDLKMVLRTEPTDKDERNARKIFLLDFMLLGINPADLYQFGIGDTEIKNDRFCFDRSKTEVINSIKIEAEAQELLRELAGNELPLFFQERYSGHENFNKYTNKFLKRYASGIGIREFTLGCARYTWATMAFNDLDIDESTVDVALGHKTNKTVAGAHYIKKCRNKVDEANRKMIDYLQKLADPRYDEEESR